MRILLWQGGLLFKLRDAAGEAEVLVAELAYLLLEVSDLALEFRDLIELPLNRVLKGNDSGGRGKDFLAQVLGD